MPEGQEIVLSSQLDVVELEFGQQYTPVMELLVPRQAKFSGQQISWDSISSRIIYHVSEDPIVASMPSNQVHTRDVIPDALAHGSYSSQSDMLGGLCSSVCVVPQIFWQLWERRPSVQWDGKTLLGPPA